MFRPSKTQQSFQDRQTYIPPHIQAAMNEQLQKTMPEHLKKYQSGGTYIPEHAQNEIAAHLENSLPTHMKQYAGAYMQQNVVAPSLARQSAGRQPVEQSGITPHAPQLHSPIENIAEDQQPGQPPAQPAVVSGGNQPAQSPDQPYDFITNPEQPAKQPLMSRLPGGGSMITRIGVAAVGLLVLLIIFIVFKNLLSSGPNLDYFVTVIQEQQELIHLTNNAIQEPSLSTVNLNFASTMQASLTTSQAQTIQYLTNNHHKINAKQLALQVSASTDNQLTTAASAQTYNPVFQQIMQSKMDAYGTTLKQAYNASTGKKGRALLKDEYRQLQLFETQLNTPAN